MPGSGCDEQRSAVAWIEDDVVDDVPEEVWALDLPFRASGIGAQQEDPLARAHEESLPGRRTPGLVSEGLGSHGAPLRALVAVRAPSRTGALDRGGPALGAFARRSSRGTPPGSRTTHPGPPCGSTPPDGRGRPTTASRAAGRAGGLCGRVGAPYHGRGGEGSGGGSPPSAGARWAGPGVQERRLPGAGAARGRDAHPPPPSGRRSAGGRIHPSRPPPRPWVGIGVVDPPRRALQCRARRRAQRASATAR